MNKIIGIYKITNPKGKVYIGESKDIYDRWNQYKNLECKRQRKIYNSLKKYGFDKHKFEIIMECFFEDLKYFESCFQEMYIVVEKGLNLRYTGRYDKKGKVSYETKNKISNSKKKLHESGYQVWNKGKKLTEEQRKKLSEDHKGKKLSNETKLKISNSHKGKKFSDEHKKKLSKNHGRSKKVINLETNEIFNNGKEAWDLNKDILGIAYPTFKDRLNGNSKTPTIFKYL